MRRVCAVMMMAAASLPAAAEPAGATAARAQFIAQHRCAVSARLDVIHQRGPIEETRDRFIVVALRGEPQRYVQCIFHDRDTWMFCEAASGAYGPAVEGRLRLGPSERAALNALGYVQASPRENFTRDVRLGEPPDVTVAADLMLAALHDGFGARPDSAIEIQAPRGGDAVAACGTPVS